MADSNHRTLACFLQKDEACHPFSSDILAALVTRSGFQPARVTLTTSSIMRDQSTRPPPQMRRGNGNYTYLHWLTLLPNRMLSVNNVTLRKSCQIIMKINENN